MIKKKSLSDSIDKPGLPIFLMVGTIYGCNAKEAAQYVRSLANRFIVSVENGYFRVLYDKESDRFVFEIQEGGSGLSILEESLKQLKSNRKIGLNIANGKSVFIHSKDNQIYSLISVNEDVAVDTLNDNADGINKLSIGRLAGSVKLVPLVKDVEWLSSAGYWLSIFSIVLIFITAFSVSIGKTYFIDSFALNKYERLQDSFNHEKNNPLHGLIAAKEEAALTGKYLAKLEFKNGEWTWDLQ